MFVEHKEQGEVTEAPAKTMKLSDQIRTGAALLPQGTCTYYENGKTCAIGAAFHAAHGYPSCGNDTVKFANKVCELLRPSGIGIGEIFIRNDRGETREQIADWLESQGY